MMYALLSKIMINEIWIAFIEINNNQNSLILHLSSFPIEKKRIIISSHQFTIWTIKDLRVVEFFKMLRINI